MIWLRDVDGDLVNLQYMRTIRKVKVEDSEFAVIGYGDQQLAESEFEFFRGVESECDMFLAQLDKAIGPQTEVIEIKEITV